MKRIYITFEDQEHRQLTKAKGQQSWHDFVMKLTEAKE